MAYVAAATAAVKGISAIAKMAKKNKDRKNKGEEVRSERKASGGSGGLKKVMDKFKGKGKQDALVGAITGTLQGIKANRLEKKSAEALPQNEDPEIRKSQGEFARRKRAYQTGTANASTQRAMSKTMNTMASRVAKAGGGRAGLAKMNETFSQGMGAMAKNNIQGELAYAGMENKAVMHMAQKKTDLAMHKSDTFAAKAANMKNSSNSNIGAALGKAVGVGTPAFAYAGKTAAEIAAAKKKKNNTQKVVNAS